MMGTAIWDFDTVNIKNTNEDVKNWVFSHLMTFTSFRQTKGISEVKV